MQTHYMRNPLTGMVCQCDLPKARELARYGWEKVKATEFRAYVVNRALRIRPMVQLSETRH